jgi:hypothetical protein
MAQAAGADVTRRFSVEQLTARLDALYQQLLAAKGILN